MILRATLLGFLLWLAVTAAFRFFGQDFFYPGETRIYVMLVATPIVCAVLTVLVLRLLREAAIDRAEAAMGLALPGMALDVYAVNAFPNVFPNLDPTLDGAFAAINLAGYAAILLTGLVTTRLAPADERV
ncbi:MAG: DUF5367 family protein [Hyphomonadaceae bacterium]